MSNKIKKAELLLDRIGEIDDSLLSEALSYRPQRRAPRFALIAACVALSVMLVLGAVGALDFISSDRFRNDKSPTSPTPTSLDEVMTELDGEYEKLSEDELPYRDGNSYLVWQYSGESGYYVASLQKTQLEELMGKMGKGDEVGESSPELECKVWIISGGSVLSPYLKSNRGNIGSEVFEYDAEIYPTADFILCVSAILQ